MPSFVPSALRFRQHLLAPVLALLWLLLAPPPRAHAQNLSWAAQYGASTQTSYVGGRNPMALDAQGNVYMTGSGGDINFVGNTTWLTVKYSKEGVLQWARYYTSSATYQPANKGTSIVVDALGNVYVAGLSGEGTTVFGASANALTLIKYNSAGTQTWVQHYMPPSPATVDGYDYVLLALTPQQDRLYFVGYVINGAGANSSYDWLTIQYNTSNGARRWLAVYNNYGSGGVNTDYPRALGVDSQGNLCLTGSSTSNVGDFLTLKYGATTGQVLWTARYNTGNSRSAFPYALVVDSQNNVAVTGYVYGGDGSTQADYGTVKYDGATGAPLWTAIYDGPAHKIDTATAIGADAAGNVYVTGYSSGGDPATSGNTGYDYATIKYDSATGTPVWTQRFDAGYSTSYSPTRDDEAEAIAVDAVGNAYVTGYSDNGTLVNFGGNGSRKDYVTVRYDRSGTQVWAVGYNAKDTTAATNGDDIPTTILQDNQGNLYVGGGTTPYNASGGPFGQPRFLIVKYALASVWTCQDIAVGADNKTRFLWNRSNGGIALWTVGTDGVIEKSATFGPYPGLTARAISLDPDNKIHLLWDANGGNPGKAIVWTVKADLSAAEAGYTFTPAGYYPWEIASSPGDGSTWLSWYDASNRVALWKLSGGTVIRSALFNAPAGYTDQAIAVGADNRANLVWNRYGADSAALWTLNATTLSTVDSALTYGIVTPGGTGWYVTDMATGADNKPRLLWTNDSHQVALWQIRPTDGAVEQNLSFGPLPLAGWVATHLSYSGGTGSDGNVRLLWAAPSGAVLLWTVDPASGTLVKTTGFGPL